MSLSVTDVIALKSASDNHAAVQDARAQLQTYLDEFPLAFRYNVLCLLSDSSGRYASGW
ncbi:hypothetical protein PJ985_11110 [Streptomyces sp. ACA25]|uniref:hypothetical protein n=1 Tax=Streptomyces sp. ACA25 TaxID=3022596 RepID=UPI0023070E2E|nr:hypothetical protein [Streptomyces sp. ACA25]MDB1088113.1 hypothetical protein [Streptomyces sp. ACA25]